MWRTWPWSAWAMTVQPPCGPAGRGRLQRLQGLLGGGVVAVEVDVVVEVGVGPDQGVARPLGQDLLDVADDRCGHGTRVGGLRLENARRGLFAVPAVGATQQRVGPGARQAVQLAGHGDGGGPLLCGVLEQRGVADHKLAGGCCAVRCRSRWGLAWPSQRRRRDRVHDHAELRHQVAVAGHQMRRRPDPGQCRQPRRRRDGGEGAGQAGQLGQAPGRGGRCPRQPVHA
jgi:hypothetical protein